MALEEIYRKYQASQGCGDKGTTHQYIASYERLFSPFKDKAITLLEIGVAQGHSLKMWREYFGKATIIGVDIKSPILDISGCEFHICNQVNRKRLMVILNKRKLDLVIDDGSHKLFHQMCSFRILFPHLKRGGMYVIEDIQDPAKHIPFFKRKLGRCEVIDTRIVSKRYDDVLLVWRK